MATTLTTNAEKKAKKAINAGSSYCKGLDLKAIKDLVKRT